MKWLELWKSILDSVARSEAFITQIAKAREATVVASLTEPAAESAFYNRTSGRVVIQLRYGATFSFPAALGQGFADASPDALADITVTPSGTGLHWEQLDADLSVLALLNGIYGNAAWMAAIANLATT